MRPVNLIPPEERHGEQAPLRSGPLAYILVGALVAVLAGVTALVLTGNQIADRENEVAQLKVEDAAAEAKAERLAAYIQFRDLSEQRVATVASLADSRFDWERVMHELSLVLPSDAWLVSLTASAAPGVGGSGSGASGLRAAAPGPALELSGCASGQEAVAGLVTALKDIDGVTRVGVQSSELAEEGAGDGAGSESSGDECRTREFIAKFEIVASFDAAPIPPSAAPEGTAVPVTEPPGDTSAEASDDSAEGSEGG
jgi:Tfp pilus assembly protein PilN